MTVPAPSEKACAKLGRRHRRPVELAIVMVAAVRRWHSWREIELLADGGYAAVDTVWAELDICWYRGETRRLAVATGMSLWHRTGSEPVALRWNLEVTFEELRSQLGFETQRGWADKTIERNTPCLFSIFSLVALLAQRLHPEKRPIPSTSWYDKQDAAFSDALAAVRLHLWAQQHYSDSTLDPQRQPIPMPIWNALVQAVCYST